MTNIKQVHRLLRGAEWGCGQRRRAFPTVWRSRRKIAQHPPLRAPGRVQNSPFCLNSALKGRFRVQNPPFCLTESKLGKMIRQNLMLYVKYMDGLCAQFWPRANRSNRTADSEHSEPKKSRIQTERRILNAQTQRIHAFRPRRAACVHRPGLRPSLAGQDLLAKAPMQFSAAGSVAASTAD